MTTLFVFVGLHNDVLAYPDNYASYPVSVRQYRILPFGFLHCCRHQQPACHLLILPGVTPAYDLSRSIGKGLAPSGKIHLLFAIIYKVYLYF